MYVGAYLRLKAFYKECTSVHICSLTNFAWNSGKKLHWKEFYCILWHRGGVFGSGCSIASYLQQSTLIFKHGNTCTSSGWELLTFLFCTKHWNKTTRQRIDVHTVGAGSADFSVASFHPYVFCDPLPCDVSHLLALFEVWGWCYA